MSITFSEIIHPELVLDRRGREYDREIYRDLFKEISYVEGAGWKALLPPEMISNEPLLHHFILTKKFSIEKPPVYRLGKDFGSVLANIDNDIPVDRLPERFFGYVSIPRGVIEDDTGHIDGGYVFIGDAKETSANPELWGKRVLWASINGASPVSPDDFSVQHILMELKGSFDEMYKSLPHIDAGPFSDGQLSKEDLNQRLAAFRLIVNTVLYVHSLEPNVDDLRPASRLSHGDRRKMKAAGKNVNLCSVPIVAVNWSYQRERVFGVEETFRREHLRWQRCGPNFSQIKLITVKGHVVRYNKSGAPEM